MIEEKAGLYPTWPVRNKVLEHLCNQNGFVIIGGIRYLDETEDRLMLWLAPTATTLNIRILNDLLRHQLTSRIKPIRANPFSTLRKNCESSLVLPKLTFEERMNELHIAGTENEEEATKNNITITGKGGDRPPRWLPTILLVYPDALLAEISLRAAREEVKLSDDLKSIIHQRLVPEGVLGMIREEIGGLPRFLQPPLYDPQSLKWYPKNP